MPPLGASQEDADRSGGVATPSEACRDCDEGPRRPRPLQPLLTAALVDVFVYVVVLNLFIEYLPFVISETFTLSLLAAVLLKFVLEGVLVAKTRVKARVKGAATPGAKVVGVLMLWAVLFGSKFLVLEAVAIVFGSRVSLGGFFSVTLLIILLLLARGGVRRLLGTST